MKRRGIGRGRPIIAAGGLLVMLGSVLPWWTIGGTVTPRLTGNAFDGIGVVAFICAVLMIALVVLPYATQSGQASIDRPLSYLILATLAVSAFAVRALEIQTIAGVGLPQQTPGLWLTGVGLGVIVWGVGELLAERAAAR
ncbi:MAG: hypothetical protein M3N29_02195 [Chloroflexota bacterium]|nr:hypothetical protein [Chloroflexota bacterium]